MKEGIILIKGKYDSYIALIVIEKLLKLGYKMPYGVDQYVKSKKWAYYDTCFRIDNKSGMIYHSQLRYYRTVYPFLEIINSDSFLKKNSLMETE